MSLALGLLDGGESPGEPALGRVWPVQGRGDTGGMGLPQQSPSLWLSLGPKWDDFLGKQLVLVGGVLALASLAQGARAPPGAGTAARPGLSPRLSLSQLRFRSQSHCGLSHLPRGCAGPRQHREGAGDLAVPHPWWGGRQGPPGAAEPCWGPPGMWHLAPTWQEPLAKGKLINW